MRPFKTQDSVANVPCVIAVEGKSSCPGFGSTVAGLSEPQSDVDLALLADALAGLAL